MENKFQRLIDLCKNGIPLTEENVGSDMILVDRNTFQLVIPKNNTDEHGIFFVYSIEGHDCTSLNTVSTHIYHVIEGTGTFIIEGIPYNVKKEDTIFIEPNKPFTYTGNMILTFDMYPNYKQENEKILQLK